MIEYALGSWRRDLAACGAVALLIAVGSLGLRVYHRVTVVELTLTRVEPDGSRHALTVPPSVWDETRKKAASRERPADMLRTQTARIRRFMTEAPEAARPPGHRVEWRIRYSENTSRLDREALIVFPRAPGP